MNICKNNINNAEIDNFILNLKENLNNELNKNILNINFNNNISNFNQSNINQYYNGILINTNKNLNIYVNHMNFLFSINSNLYYIKKQIYFYNKSIYFNNISNINIYNIRIKELKNVKKEITDLKLLFINYLKIYLKNIKNNIKDIIPHETYGLYSSYNNDSYILIINNDIENIINYIDLSIHNLNKNIMQNKIYQKYKNNFLYYGKRFGILSLGILFYYLY